MHRIFKYRLYPTKRQARVFAAWLVECCWLYNHFLAERKAAWDNERKITWRFDQCNALPELKTEHPTLLQVYAQTLQNVATRIDLAYRAFFRRCKAGEHPGYPRFKSVRRYDSFTFPQFVHGCEMRAGVLHLPIIGDVRFAQHRDLRGSPKTCTIKRASAGRWFVFVTCVDVPPAAPAPAPTAPSVGIDMGLRSFATLSTGEAIENPRFFRAAERRIAKGQRRLSAEPKGTSTHERLRRAEAKMEAKVACQRHDFVHQASRRIVNRFGLIAVEALEVARLLRRPKKSAPKLSKSIQDVAWSMFLACLAYKAEEAGRTLVAVNPAYTSQDCSRCAHRQRMLLRKRVYRCPSCGLELDRDHNAALNILAVGLHSLGASPRSP